MNLHQAQEKAWGSPEQNLTYHKEMVKRSSNAIIQRSVATSEREIALEVATGLINDYDLVALMLGLDNDSQT